MHPTITFELATNLHGPVSKALQFANKKNLLTAWQVSVISESAPPIGRGQSAFGKYQIELSSDTLREIVETLQADRHPQKYFNGIASDWIGDTLAQHLTGA